MSTTNSEADINALRDDLAALKRDVANLIEHFSSSATTNAQNAASQIDEGVRQFYSDATAKGGETAKLVGKQIEEQPIAALLIALGLGYITGRVLSR